MRAAIVALVCLLSTLSTLAGSASAGSTAAWTPRRPARSTATFQRLVAAQTEPAWIGYSVADVRPAANRHGCAATATPGSPTASSSATAVSPPAASSRAIARTGPPGTAGANQGPIHLEGPDTMVVLYRIEDKAVQRVRIFSPDCELDAGGRAIHWLDGVGARRLDRAAVVAGDAATDPARAAARLAAAGDAPSDEIAVPALLDRWRRAGSEAREGPRRCAVLAGADGGRKARPPRSPPRIDNDPDTDVKKRAVFALSQLPKDEGVPLLIKVAKTNQNPAVRKQAMFWLGQSKDPRALQFFAADPRRSNEGRSPSDRASARRGWW